MSRNILLQQHYLLSRGGYIEVFIILLLYISIGIIDINRSKMPKNIPL